MKGALGDATVTNGSLDRTQGLRGVGFANAQLEYAFSAFNDLPYKPCSRRRAGPAHGAVITGCFTG